MEGTRQNGRHDLVFFNHGKCNEIIINETGIYG